MTFLQKFNLVDDIRIESKEKRFEGFFKIDEVSFKHRLFAGGWSESIRRELFAVNNCLVSAGGPDIRKDTHSEAVHLF